MRTQEYDINFYVNEGVLSISAYELMIDSEGDITTNSDKWHTLSIKLNSTDPEDIAILGKVLGDEWDYLDPAFIDLESDNLDEELEQAIADNWQEFDEWVDTKTIVDIGLEKIDEWYDNLPEYEMEKK